MTSSPWNPLRLVFGFALSLALVGCPRKSNEERAPSPPRPCQKFGDTCEFSPNKLGSCMTRENCTEGNCLFCQSQH